jgi:prepilin-type N-terminal cleavage/methylation domain-containing protein
MKREAGFTLLEVMIAMLIGTIGLLGTLAVQQAIISASKNANDAAVAMRLASQKLEELGSRNTDTQANDASDVGLAKMSTPINSAINWEPTDANGQRVPEYADAEGNCLRDTNGKAMSATSAQLGRYRWRRQWSVVNTGTGLPYVISVIVSYNNDSGDVKTVRLDMERRKAW